MELKENKINLYLLFFNKNLKLKKKSTTFVMWDLLS